MHGILRWNIVTGVYAFARSADVSLRDITIARDGKRGLASANDVTHRKCVEDFARFWKSHLVELRPASGEDGWLSLARGDLCGGCHTCGGCRWKSQDRKIVPLSSYVEKPLNSKVIKSFVPELRSRYVFFEFRDSYVLVIYVMNTLRTFRMVSLWFPGRNTWCCVTLNYLYPE